MLKIEMVSRTEFFTIELDGKLIEVARGEKGGKVSYGFSSTLPETTVEMIKSNIEQVRFPRALVG